MFFVICQKSICRYKSCPCLFYFANIRKNSLYAALFFMDNDETATPDDETVKINDERKMVYGRSDP